MSVKNSADGWVVDGNENRLSAAKKNWMPKLEYRHKCSTSFAPRGFCFLRCAVSGFVGQVCERRHDFFLARVIRRHDIVNGLCDASDRAWTRGTRLTCCAGSFTVQVDKNNNPIVPWFCWFVHTHSDECLGSNRVVVFTARS